ncbi:hypothetical protein [Paenibacillus thiaminolyticus]|uniref:hypothetical protein n=1 Tax=Paenibacillus thiaminolyticus TaxID=49283 RepID=UPI0025437762|nr:hypothetical protein [Paenibacillus thiaminolyticus]WII36306.1 hypothetical protein O0V01_21930 [Paenibacillus thiaminolyticus]
MLQRQSGAAWRAHCRATAAMKGPHAQGVPSVQRGLTLTAVPLASGVLSGHVSRGRCRQSVE